jgi:hypothetical protein
VVATSASAPSVQPCANEVDRIVEVSVSSLANGAGLKRERREREGSSVEVPYFDLDGAKLWGATAMVVAELLAVLGATVDPWGLR